MVAYFSTQSPRESRHAEGSICGRRLYNICTSHNIILVSRDKQTTVRNNNSVDIPDLAPLSLQTRALLWPGAKCIIVMSPAILKRVYICSWMKTRGPLVILPWLHSQQTCRSKLLGEETALLAPPFPPRMSGQSKHWADTARAKRPLASRVDESVQTWTQPEVYL